MIEYRTINEENYKNIYEFYSNLKKGLIQNKVIIYLNRLKRYLYDNKVNLGKELKIEQKDNRVLEPMDITNGWIE